MCHEKLISKQVWVIIIIKGKTARRPEQFGLMRRKKHNHREQANADLWSQIKENYVSNQDGFQFQFCFEFCMTTQTHVYQNNGKIKGVNNIKLFLELRLLNL